MVSIKTALDIKFIDDTITFYWKEKEELTLQIKNIINSYVNGSRYILKYLNIKTYKSDTSRTQLLKKEIYI